MEKRVTASELRAKLEADPEYRKRKREAEARHAEKAAELLSAEKPLIEDLTRVGFPVKSVWDLVSNKGPYSEAIPILLNHMHRSYPDRVKEGIARALAVPHTTVTWLRILDEYKDTAAACDYKHGLAAALGATSSDDIMPYLQEVIIDPVHGESRLLLLKALRRSSLPSSKRLLDELSDDPTFSKEIRSWGRSRMK